MAYLDQVTDSDIAAMMEQAFSSVEDVCSQLGDHEWDLPTDLPGWSVKDNLSHMAHYEGVLAGRAQQDARLPDLDRVQNDFQRANEIGVEARRALPGRDVLEEFRDVTSERAKTLASWTDTEWAADVPSPFGMMPARRFIPIRILDVFYHEQDIRRATNRPGHLSGDVARFVFERFATQSMGRVIVKEAGAPEGTVVVFDVAAPGRPVTLKVADGKGIEAIESSGTATVRFFCDLEAFFCLLGGRKTAQWLADEGRLRVEGDQDLAGRILSHIVVVP